MGYAQMAEVSGETMEGHRTFLQALGEEPPEGLILRCAGPTTGGIRVVTVWESKAAHDRFVAERLYPTMQQTNSALRPQILGDLDTEELWTAGVVGVSA